MGAKGSRSTGGGGGGGAGAGAATQTETSAMRLSPDLNAVLYGLPQDKQKALYYRSGYSEDTINKMTAEEQSNYAKYDAVTINEDLPEITGSSQRQIDFAKSVRDRAISQQIADINNRLDGFINKKTSRGSTEAKRKALDAQFEHEQVKTRSALIAKILRSSKGAYSKYKNMTSAKDILDNR